MAIVRAPLPPGAILATIASGTVIAQQVAGKAARDAMFLSNFSVTLLPTAMATAAVLSLAAVVWISRLIVRHSPARVLPVLFGLTVVSLLAEWAVSFQAPGIAALAVYLHTAL